MKKMNRLTSVTSIAAGVLALCMVTGCGTSKPVLRICTWSDYIDDGVVRQFEKQNGCRVEIKTFDSNEEMYDCLKAGDEEGIEWAIVEQDYMNKLDQKQSLTCAYYNMKETGDVL